MKIAILRNEDPDSGRKWQLACEKIHLSFDIIDLTSANWLQQIQKDKYSFFLLKPPGLLSHYKSLYDERLYVLTKELKYTTFPSFEECYIYENKKLLSYFLQANNIPHPQTTVFYSKQEALSFIQKTLFPIVSKTSIGASGTGVLIIKDRDQASKYIHKAFSRNGIKRRLGPNRVTGSANKWIIKAIKNPKYFLIKLQEYLSVSLHGERDFVIFQEYIPHEFEWRSVKIGNNFFAHKKIKYSDKASGSKGIDYVCPPESILKFTRDLCENHNFHFMAVDLFEDGKGGYLVNELQTIFGHIQNFILAVDGKPGRFRFINNQWVFEEGDFNTNESYDLRLKTALELFENGRP
jgi:glutathione synthase/RimK-type ligase-like ATP-grasp enzyme